MAIKKMPNGLYQVRVAGRINKQLKSFKQSNIQNLGDARQKQNEFLQQIKTLQAKARLGIVTWGEAKAEYKTKSANILAVSTHYTQVTTLDQYTSEWDCKTLTDFNSEFIKSAIALKMADKSGSTKNNLAKFIRNVFELQIGLGRIQFNPGKGVKFDDGGLKRKKLAAMSRDEILHLFEQVKDITPEWYVVYRVTYELGLRSGEAYALKKKHICLKTNRVTIIEAYCSKAKTDKEPKNKEFRIVPLNQGLRELLAERIATLNDNDYVLPRIPGWKHGDAAKVLRSFQQKFGIKETNFHSIRASFITHLINANIPIPQIQAMVGHKDLKTTQDYIRLDRTDLDGATEALDIAKKKIASSFWQAPQ
jgi:integrase